MFKYLKYNYVINVSLLRAKIIAWATKIIFLNQKSQMHFSKNRCIKECEIQECIWEG